jgi:hypothetical protein
MLRPVNHEGHEGHGARYNVISYVSFVVKIQDWRCFQKEIPCLSTPQPKTKAFAGASEPGLRDDHDVSRHHGDVLAHVTVVQQIIEMDTDFALFLPDPPHDLGAIPGGILA